MTDVSRCPPLAFPVFNGRHSVYDIALERSVRSEHIAGCYCCLDSVVVGGFLQGRVAAVSLEVMRERDAFNQNN